MTDRFDEVSKGETFEGRALRTFEKASPAARRQGFEILVHRFVCIDDDCQEVPDFADWVLFHDSGLSLGEFEFVP